MYLQLGHLGLQQINLPVLEEKKSCNVKKMVTKQNDFNMKVPSEKLFLGSVLCLPDLTTLNMFTYYKLRDNDVGKRNMLVSDKIIDN